MGRGWCFAAGLPVGALAGLALGGAAALPLAAGAIAGGVAVFAVGWACARGGRGAGVAAVAQVGWLALPAAVYAWLGVGPGAAVSGWVVAALLLASLLWLGGRRAGAPLPVALLAVVVGGLGWGLLAGALAAWGAAPPSLGEATAAAIYDLDARVVNRPLPLCGAGPGPKKSRGTCDALRYSLRPARYVADGSRLESSTKPPIGPWTRSRYAAPASTI